MPKPIRRLEFVTISKPEDIKDPAKQKAIRRQARKRDNSTPNSREKVKVIIDLPGIDINTPSYELLQSIRAYAGYESLTCPDFLKLNVLAINLINYVRQGGDGKFCPLMAFWWNIGQLDQTAFMITLANASRTKSEQAGIGFEENTEALGFYSKSIQSLQQRLVSPLDAMSEGVIVSVLEFAYYDYLWNDLPRWLVHMKGLTSLIQRRGGIETLYRSEMIVLLNFWIDVSGSFIFDRVPFFPPPPAHFLVQIQSEGTPFMNSAVERWNTAFPELADITKFLQDATVMLDHIDERAMRSEVWTDDMFVCRAFNVVVHQLLSLPRDRESIDNGTATPPVIIREAMRRACMLIFGMLRDKFTIHSDGFIQHRHRVKELLQQILLHQWSGFLELKLWILFVAALAPEEDEDTWYFDQIKLTMSELGVSDWDEGLEVARSVLWMREEFRLPIKKAKFMFDQAI